MNSTCRKGVSVRRISVGCGIAVLSICLFASTATAARTVRVGPKANGSTVTFRVGDTLVVSLPGNATTGYAWRVRLLDQIVLKVARVTYVARKTGTIGAGGTYVFRFRAVAAGKARMKLGYAQSGGMRPTKTFALVVVVR
jgi:inhibitor of cysteine peptidase